MKALILVGGYGTRLRPLTFSCPKPLVEFVNKPIVEHQIEALIRVGVKEIVLAISYQPDAMKDFILNLEKKVRKLVYYLLHIKHQIKITCSLETEPLGTAGPIRLAQEILLCDNPDDLFFVFNSDVICEFPLEELIAVHKKHGREGTIFLAEVTDPSKYGVVVSLPNGQVQRFVEKPTEFISNQINAGLYLFNTSLIKRIELRPTSIEKEIFPLMAQQGELYSLPLKGFWMDIGQPKDYLIGTELMLNSLRNKTPELLAQGSNIQGNVLIDESAQVNKNCLLGPNVVIGPGCVVHEGVRLQNCVLLRNAVVKENSWLSKTIVGWNSVIGRWCRVEGVTVFGENVKVRDELYVNQSFVLPHRDVSANISQAGTIVM